VDEPDDTGDALLLAVLAGELVVLGGGPVQAERTILVSDLSLISQHFASWHGKLDPPSPEVLSNKQRRDAA